MWQGIGHGASIYSACALPPMIGLPRERQPAAHRHLLPRLIGWSIRPVYGAVVAVADSS